MLFLPSSVRLSLRFSSLTACLATVGWKAPKRHWLAQTSTSLSSTTSCSSTSSLLYPRPHFTMFLKSSPLELRCPRKYFCVDAIRRENLQHPGFLHFFFPAARPSPRLPTLSLLDLDVHRTYGLRSWNFSSLFALFQYFSPLFFSLSSSIWLY